MNTGQNRDVAWIAFNVGIFVLLTLALVVTSEVHAQVPSACNAYQREITAAVHNDFGTRANVSTFAGQVLQESGCNATARSHAGALGLTQFMPRTAAALAAQYPRDVGPVDLLNPSWSIRAHTRLMRDLVRSYRVDGLDECAAHWYALRAYNGGPSRLATERKLATLAGFDARAPPTVEKFNAGRSAANFRENIEYPRRILFRHAPRFVVAGWGSTVDCMEYAQ